MFLPTPNHRHPLLGLRTLRIRQPQCGNQGRIGHLSLAAPRKQAGYFSPISVLTLSAMSMVQYDSCFNFKRRPSMWTFPLTHPKRTIQLMSPGYLHSRAAQTAILPSHGIHKLIVRERSPALVVRGEVSPRGVV
ncbi:hypothetical protein VTH82DRAFT_7287 [Thermothelomyces myriococcoides]